LIQYFPTDLATLTGFEAKVEHDLSSSWTTWAAGHYVHGTDETLNQPLWGISPLEGQLGLNYHHAENPDLWGIETIARFVDSQNRLGRIRAGSPPLFNQGLVPIESYTPAFVTVNIRGYWEPQLNNPRSKVRLIAGVENLLDATYLQHLDLRLPNSNGFDEAFALYPGITPYAGFDWTY
jgi:outer membrane receptor protein involved in Fe transport